MELKKYQVEVLNDLTNYLDNLVITRNSSNAYKKLWIDKQVRVGFDGMPSYKDNFNGTPSVCLKVPTGGGKTVLACSSLKNIFDRMSTDKKKVVVWLVPWETILSQTYDALKNPNHFYRKTLDNDFLSRVKIYNKEDLLNGIDFNPTIVNEQLSVLLFTYDTFRSNDKDNRKVYEQNSNLISFVSTYEHRDKLLADVDESALVQVINQLNPVVVIDESHNATSNLSVEMINNLNPSFVLELTATPRESSNIISIVSAEKLKEEHMVKLPVIAYNRPSIERVICESIDLRQSLENKAMKLHNRDPKKYPYIRPIVLFQAQPKKSTDTVTFDKIKQNLIDLGIPKEQIAIKVSKKNELNGVNLMSKTCPIRFIITVNALKEGWDCPFAYILSSLTNKTSKIDVEQILGRILRQPYQTQFEDPVLNMSYVLSSSNDFNATLKSIIEGLNSSGFSKNDCRAIEESLVVNEETESKDESTPTTLFEFENEDNSDIDGTNFNIENIKEEVKNIIEEKVNKENSEGISVDSMLNEALTQENEYRERIEHAKEEGDNNSPSELSNKMNNFKMNSEFKDEISKIILPQFAVKKSNTIFSDDNSIELLTKEDLTDGFNLDAIPLPTNLLSLSDDVYKIDIISNDEGNIAKQFSMNKSDSEIFKNMLQNIPENGRVNQCKLKLINDLSNKFTCISFKDLENFVKRLLSKFNADEIIYVQNNIMSVEIKLRYYIEHAIDEYRYKYFKNKLEVEEIFLQYMYSFPKTISPISTISLYPKSLYTEEENNLTDIETKLVTKISNMDNVLCWHRIIEKRGFCLNGYINHYPDFVVFTKKGKIVLIETKGEHLANENSLRKLELGKLWENKAGSNKYRYYMVFMTKEFNEDGAVNLDHFCEILKNL